MHIDHSKLVELLAETSGIEKEKIEKQLNELVSEINAAIKEGDAYEVEGFGVFSGIGNNIIFIPADELATEINYKYVGMEPIELDDASSETSGEATISEGDLDEDDPFAGLLDDDGDSDEIGDEETAKPSFELDTSEDEDEDDSIETYDPESEPSFTDENDDSEADDEAPFELDISGEDSDEEPEEEKPGPDKWGIDTYKDDNAENMFSGLLGESEKEEQEEEGSVADDEFSSLFEKEDSDDADEEPSSLADELNKQFSDEEKEDEQKEEPILGDFFSEEEDEEEDPGLDSQLSEEEEPEESFEEPEPVAEKEDEDFDDPFESLAEEEDEDVEFEEESDKEDSEDEVIPVITNLASESARSEKPEEKEEDKKEKKKTTSSRAGAKKQPVLLWVFLIIVILSGGTYGLGYFGVLYIPGVTPQPQVATTPPTPSVEQPVTQSQPEPVTQQDLQETPPAQPETQTQPEEQPSQPAVSEQEAPASQPRYGMRGTSVPAANDGFTIVVFSLSNERNARAKQRELSDDGYRALIAAIPSQQYGTLWRVSLGQFQSLRDAAIAAEDLRPPYSENYFITNIQ